MTNLGDSEQLRAGARLSPLGMANENAEKSSVQY